MKKQKSTYRKNHVSTSSALEQSHTPTSFHAVQHHKTGSINKNKIALKKKSVSYDAKNDTDKKQEFNSIVREIRQLTFSSLGKFEQLKIRTAELKAAGRKPDKRRAMPAPEQRLRRAAADRAITKQLEKEKELGVKMYHGKKTVFDAENTKRNERLEKTRRKKHGHPTTLAGVGHDKGGHVRLKSQFVKKYYSPKSN